MLMGTGGGVVAQGLAQAEFEMGLGWMEDEIERFILDAFGGYNSFSLILTPNHT